MVAAGILLSRIVGLIRQRVAHDLAHGVDGVSDFLVLSGAADAGRENRRVRHECGEDDFFAGD